MKNNRASKIVASSISRISMLAVEEVSPEVSSMNRSIERSLGELNRMCSDFIFDAQGVLEDKGKAFVKALSIAEDGTCVCKLAKEFKVANVTAVSELLTKAKTYTIQDKFKQFVTWEFLSSGEADVVTLVVQLKIPADVMESAVGASPVEQWKKAIGTAEKMCKKYATKL